LASTALISVALFGATARCHLSHNFDCASAALRGGDESHPASQSSNFQALLL
jgi:hypothetical protein